MVCCGCVIYVVVFFGAIKHKAVLCFSGFFSACSCLIFFFLKIWQH